MAKKKKTTTTSSNSDIVKACAYIGLVVAAIAAILSFIFGLLNYCGVQISWSGRLIGICNTISQIALLVAVIIPAYRFCRYKSVAWRAFFWVAIIFIVLGLVGINLIF